MSMRSGLLAVTIFALATAAGCRTSGSYAERGEYVEMMRDHLVAYSRAEWYAWSDAYADSAAIFVNSTIPMTVEDRLAANRAQLSLFDEVTIVQPLIGEVHNTDGETWVLVWGAWTGSVRGSDREVSVPMHIAARFSGGKVDQEWIYMDEEPLERAALEAAEPDSTGALPRAVSDSTEADSAPMT